MHIYIYIICNYHDIPKGTFDDEFLAICRPLDRKKYRLPSSDRSWKPTLGPDVFSCFLLQVPPTPIIRIPHEPYDSDRDLILVVGGAKTLCQAYESLQDTTPHPTQANPPH